MLEIEALLEKHIRFEERELFGEIQYSITEEYIEKLKQIPEEKVFEENNTDKFWE
ncbi:MAG: hypothetical protein HYZ42_02715 [Bacteroidetes bacterium]|nr:hypothetical protein [Bacteroidota bacterium]